eukprot:m.307469 g.307469  ORF g.307469 m.307469 type:complete len:1363 (+) comp16362_c0_seq3:267-4355(+)
MLCKMAPSDSGPKVKPPSRLGFLAAAAVLAGARGVDGAATFLNATHVATNTPGGTYTAELGLDALLATDYATSPIGRLTYPLAQETRALYPTVTVLVPPDGVVPLCGASTALTDTSCAWPGVPYVGAGANNFTVHAANASFLVQNFRVENITTTSVTCRWDGGTADATIDVSVTMSGVPFNSTGAVPSLAGTVDVGNLSPFMTYTLVPVQRFPTSFLRLPSVEVATQSLASFGAIRPEHVQVDSKLQRALVFFVALPTLPIELASFPWEVDFRIVETGLPPHNVPPFNVVSVTDPAVGLTFAMVLLRPFTMYSMRVRYLAASGAVSDWSDYVNDTTLPGPQAAPQVSQAQSPNSTHIRISWELSHVDGVIVQTKIFLFNKDLVIQKVETCDPPCRTFDLLEFVPFVSVRVDNVVGNGTASFPLQLTANPLPQQSGDDSDDATTVGALVTVVVVSVILMVVVIYIVRARHETRRKAMLPADYRGIIARLERAAKAAGHAVEFRREEDGTLRRKSIGASLKGSEGDDEDGTTGERGIRHFDMPPELNRKDVVLERCIGSGQFGEVHVGQLTTYIGRVRGSVAVAVKMTLSEDDALPLLEEGVVTWLFIHPNVVQMHGAVTSGLPKLLVLEYCGNGSLIEWLQAAEAVRETGELLLIMHGISAGMKYLASRRFVHRDLAARNILLGDDMTPKIADFGLSRCFDTSEYYRVATDRMLPVRWTDPYAVETDVFSEMTDVWSFGVLGIELFTKGARPYGAWSNLLVLDSTRNGFRLHKPPEMPNELYDHIVFPCWASSETPEIAIPANMLGSTITTDEPKVHSYKHRPSFEELHQRLGVLCVEYQQRAQFADSGAADVPREEVPRRPDSMAGVPANTSSVNDGIGTETEGEMQVLYDLRHRTKLGALTEKSRSSPSSTSAGTAESTTQRHGQWATISPTLPDGGSQVEYRIHSSVSSATGGSSATHPEGREWQERVDPFTPVPPSPLLAYGSDAVVSTPTGAGGSRPASASSTGGFSSPYAHTQLQPNSGAVGGDSGASGPDVGGAGPHAPYAHTNLAAARSGSSPGLSDRSAGSSEGASPAPSPYAHTSLGVGRRQLGTGGGVSSPLAVASPRSSVETGLSLSSSPVDKQQESGGAGRPASAGTGVQPYDTARFSSGADAGRTAASTQALLTAPLTPGHRLPSTDSTTSLPSTDGTVTPTAATSMSLPPSSTGHTPAATGGGPTSDLPAAVEEGGEAEAEAGGFEAEGTRSGLTRGTVVVDAGAHRQPRQPLVRGGLSRAAGTTPPGGSGGGISRAPPSAGSFLDSAIVSDDAASSIALNTTSLYALTSVAGDGARKAAGGQRQAEGASESESETPAGRGRRTSTLV